MRKALLTLPLVALIACTGNIGEPKKDFVPQIQGRGVIDTAMCEDKPRISLAAPMRRLTPIEYNNTVAQLFPGQNLPNAEIEPGTTVQGFTHLASGQGLGDAHVESFSNAAVAIADAVTANLDWLPCDSTTFATDPGCRTQFIQSFVGNAYRRELRPEEVTRLEAALSQGATDFGTRDAVNGFVSAILQSPDFLYRPEFGSTDAGENMGTIPLNAFEMASRLSYLFWESAPDEQLMAAARDGSLMTDEGIDRESRRLLADPKARPVIRRFHWEWLELARIDSVKLDADVFPDFDQAMRDDLKGSAVRFMEHAFWEANSFNALMTSNVAFVNDRLAPIFGVPAPGSNELTMVTLPENERAGILTQPGVLASTSHDASHSPILRGVMVLNRFICSPPPPPPDLSMLEEAPKPDIEPRTVRERLEAQHGRGSECQSCHASIDGIGFSFEHYDAVGQYRIQENGVDVDSTGEIVGTADVDGPVVDAVELASKLASSAEVRQCFAAHWFRFALARPETLEDDCNILDMSLSLAEGQSMQDILINLAKSPPFRSRPVAEGAMP